MTIALASNGDLEDKDESVTRLLIHLVENFGDEIIFTGGTSLLKRGIIDRFSEDIDILTTKSKKAIKKFIDEKLPDYSIIDTKDGSSIVQHEILNNAIEIKLDVVSYKEDSKKILGEPLHGIKSINGEIDNSDITIQVKSVELILIDKICALFEEYEQIKNFNFQNEKKSNNPRSKKRKHNISQSKVKLRRVRDFYDIYKIIGNIELETKFSDKLIAEINKRLHTSNRYITDETIKTINSGEMQRELIEACTGNIDKLVDEIKEQTFGEFDKDDMSNRLAEFINSEIGKVMNNVQNK